MAALWPATFLEGVWHDNIRITIKNIIANLVKMNFKTFNFNWLHRPLDSIVLSKDYCSFVYISTPCLKSPISLCFPNLSKHCLLVHIYFLGLVITSVWKKKINTILCLNKYYIYIIIFSSFFLSFCFDKNNKTTKC